MSAQPILTYDDYIALPEDGPRYELYEGELIVMPATSPRHQAVIVNLFIAVAQHVWGHGLGDVSPAPIDVILSPITVVQPDLVYVDTAGPGIVTDGGIEARPRWSSKCSRPRRRRGTEASSKRSTRDTVCRSTGSWTRPRGPCRRYA